MTGNLESLVWCLDKLSNEPGIYNEHDIYTTMTTEKDSIRLPLKQQMREKQLQLLQEGLRHFTSRFNSFCRFKGVLEYAISPAVGIINSN